MHTKGFVEGNAGGTEHCAPSRYRARYVRLNIDTNESAAKTTEVGAQHLERLAAAHATTLEAAAARAIEGLYLAHNLPYVVAVGSVELERLF